MSDPFLAQITMFAGNFAPRGWALCEGQTLAIAQNTAVFSLLGTTYGGNGRTDFKLPDLRGRSPIQQGTGPGLSPRQLGSTGGGETVTLNQANLPPHAHSVAMPVNANEVDGDDPVNKFLGVTGEDQFANAATAGKTMASFDSGSIGSATPVQTMNPFLALNFLIALVGTFPSRS